MIGRIKLSGKITPNINGKTLIYTSGESIKKGSFVKLVNDIIQKVTSSEDMILGIAKTSGTNGQTIEVIVPNI